MIGYFGCVSYKDTLAMCLELILLVSRRRMFPGMTCGTTRWKAAKAVSKSLANFNESGLEVAGCRHAIGQKAVNMFRGEM